jgi:hypothetical protein
MVVSINYTDKNGNKQNYTNNGLAYGQTIREYLKEKEIEFDENKPIEAWTE